MSRPQKTNPELVRLSDHVAYTAWMVHDLAPRLPNASSQGEAIDDNARVEAFVVLARSLWYFLFKESSDGDDVVISDYLSAVELSGFKAEPVYIKASGRTEFCRLIGAPTEPNANKLNTHLTYIRGSMVPHFAQWPCLDIERELSGALRAFATLADPCKLSADARNYLVQLPKYVTPATGLTVSITSATVPRI